MYKDILVAIDINDEMSSTKTVVAAITEART